MLFRSFDAYKRLIEIYPSDSNAIEFCQGTFSEMNEDIYEMIRYFGERKKIKERKTNRYKERGKRK